MNLEERQKQIVDEFSQLKGWEQRYKHLIDIGKQLPDLEDQFKVDDLKVKGCQSQVWIQATINDNNKVIFRGDSDALIVKGLVALLLRVYSEAKPDEILSTEPQFIADIGLSSHLSPSRTNGLMSMVKQIKYYATAYQAMLSLRPTSES